MIIELLCTPLFWLINGLVSFIPVAFQIPNWLADTISLLLKAMQFFPFDVWTIILANIGFWLFAQFAWAIIEWVYKKIPGVD